MQERQVTKMGGNLITLVGPELHVGDVAPDFMALNTDLLPKSLEDYQGKIKLITVVPSLDTSVCDAQTRKFNEMAADFSPEIEVLTVSMDLPFAQKRWCRAAGVDRIETLSDHRFASFGENYGVLIEELRLLNSSVFLIDKSDMIQYVEIVEENHNHPDYEAALAALHTLV